MAIKSVDNKSSSSSTSKPSSLSKKPIVSSFENLIQRKILQKPIVGLSIDIELEELGHLETELRDHPTLKNFTNYQAKIRNIVSSLLPKAFKVAVTKSRKTNASYEVEKVINDELANVYRNLLTLNKDVKSALISMNAIKGLIINELR